MCSNPAHAIFNESGTARCPGGSLRIVDLSRLRARLPLFVFVAVVILLLLVLGFACACLSDHPVQVLERVLTAMASLPPIVVVWVVVGSLGFASMLRARETVLVASGRSSAELQRFLF